MNFEWFSNFIHPVPKAQALLDEGFMSILLGTEQSKLASYWDHMLLDFPDHPAKVNPKTALPITLYGVLAKSNYIVIII